MYDFEPAGTEEYVLKGSTKSIPTIIFIDNQATVRMTRNYKINFNTWIFAKHHLR